MMTSHSVYSLLSAKQWKFQDHGIYSGATKKGREWVLKELKATMGFAARVRQMTEDNKAHAQIPSGLAEINTGSCHTKNPMRNAESFPTQSVCTDDDDDPPDDDDDDYDDDDDNEKMKMMMMMMMMTTTTMTTHR